MEEQQSHQERQWQWHICHVFANCVCNKFCVAQAEKSQQSFEQIIEIHRLPKKEQQYDRDICRHFMQFNRSESKKQTRLNGKAVQRLYNRREQ